MKQQCMPDMWWVIVGGFVVITGSRNRVMAGVESRGEGGTDRARADSGVRAGTGVCGKCGSKALSSRSVRQITKRALQMSL